MGIFPEAQWQLTPDALVGFSQILNPSEILWSSLLPARMKKIQSEKRGYSIHNSFPIITCCHENQSSNSICLKTLCSLAPPQ